jgi:hypothetical protein
MGRRSGIPCRRGALIRRGNPRPSAQRPAIPTIEDQRALKLENARADERFSQRACRLARGGGRRSQSSCGGGQATARARRTDRQQTRRSWDPKVPDDPAERARHRGVGACSTDVPPYILPASWATSRTLINNNAFVAPSLDEDPFTVVLSRLPGLQSLWQIDRCGMCLGARGNPGSYRHTVTVRSCEIFASRCMTCPVDDGETSEPRTCDDVTVAGDAEGHEELTCPLDFGPSIT